jgi:RimJ/RimL family protein N-acetyltransferase
MDLDFSKSIILENGRVRLEPLSMAHVELLREVGAHDQDLMRFSPSAVHTHALLSSYVENALEERERGTKYSFAIYDKQVGTYAGSTSYGNVANPDLRLEIGWTWIGKEFQRTGLNRNCKFLLLTYAFETLEFERVEFKTDSRNLQSRKAIEQIGGVFEGEFRSHSIMSDGFRRNTVYYSILKNEWPNLRDSVFLTI